MDMAKTLPPTVQLYGIDLSTRLFPKAVPPNVQFLQHSVTSLPPSWTDKFHFVNQRYLTPALLVEEWPVALGEIYRVLRPGGQIQLIEPTYVGVSREDDKPLPPACARFSAVIEHTLAGSGHDAFCAKNLPQYLRQAGFMEFDVHVCPIPLGARAGDRGVKGRDVLVRVWKAIAKSAAALNAMTRDQYLTLVDDMAKEVDTLEGAIWPIHVVAARKRSV